jgi:CDP-diacylglycerol--glycerol-3-phosphate 3-phosphatidyltransferase
MVRQNVRANKLKTLRVQWGVFTFAGLTFLVIVAWLTRRDTISTPWLFLAAFFFLYQVIVFYFDLHKNHPKGSRTLFPRFGFGTWLSLLRLLALSLLAGFLFTPRFGNRLAWAPFSIYLFFNLADLFDGYIARRQGHVTRLGEKLDLDMDVRGMLLGSVLAVQYGAAGWWYLLIGLARYLYLAGLWVRRRLGLPVIEKANPLSRPLAGLQMGVSTALLAPVLSPPYTVLISSLTMAVFLGNFFYDWLVIGKRDHLTFAIPQTASRLFPLASRGIVVALIAYRIISGRASDSDLYVEIFIATVLSLGAGTRVVALALLVHLGLLLQSNLPQATEIMLVIFSLGSVYLGAGSQLVWSPENTLIRKRLGERGS